jgi:hypothetical protein
MKPLRISACLLAGLLLTGLTAGCASAGGQAYPAAGHLAGKFVREGGPLLGPGGKQPAERPLSGTVTFTAAGHQVVTVEVGPSGVFSVSLPPGQYRVSGRSSGIVEIDGGHSRELPCTQPTPVVVTAGQAGTITLACIVP